MSERKMKTVAVLITLITILVIGTISYAFFITSVDNTNKETVTAGSAKISLVFDDNDNGISATLNPGKSITKKFTLENTGTVDALCKLSWKELYNTYSANNYNSDCKNQLGIRFQTWFLSPAAGSPSEAIGFTGGDNQISSISTSSALALSSTAYLKSDVYIKSGMGSQNNPFVLKLNY